MQTFEERLARVPWLHRKTANGDARDVPNAIRDIISPDSTVRMRAYWKLDNHVVLQSDLYEAAYDVIPFLIEILEEHGGFGRDLVYDLLIEIASGYAPDHVTCSVRSGGEARLRDACAAAVRAGIEVYRLDGEDTDPQVRSRASELLMMIA